MLLKLLIDSLVDCAVNGLPRQFMLLIALPACCLVVSLACIIKVTFNVSNCRSFLAVGLSAYMTASLISLAQ